MRTKYGIGALVLIALLVWNSLSSTYADPASTAESGEPGPLMETQTESSSASRSSTRGESDREETPAEPFIPSESVSADSAVSFPVDI
jgi:hypothetical protein